MGMTNAEITAQLLARAASSTTADAIKARFAAKEKELPLQKVDVEQADGSIVRTQGTQVTKFNASGFKVAR